MKFVSRILLLLPIPLTATFAVAQSFTQGTFKHIIVIAQENRTPDNLFGSSPGHQSLCGQENNPVITGADIDNGGYGYINGTRQLICNMSLPLNGWDSEIPQGANTSIGIISPDHTYDGGNNYQPPPSLGWVADYAYDPNSQTGKMDGFCHEYGNTNLLHPCPSYSYVDGGDVAPYFFIAQNYGFGNYMFQSNQGPSFTAHQFLFTGTSAPVAPNYTSNNDNLDFVAEYAYGGCPYSGTHYPKWVTPDGTPLTDPIGSECYAHDTLVTAATACDSIHHCDRGISWGYYGPSSFPQWNAPRANPQTCYGTKDPQGGSCQGPEYDNHVHLANVNNYHNAPIFDALYNCTQPLPAISWVIPDGRWSDHPFSTDNQYSLALGPYWVGDIINAVGSACGGKYWSGPGSEPTAVIVTWDDWGGWFDHVNPNPFPGVWRGTWDSVNQKWDCSPPNGSSTGWGCGYVHGFRVPLLVVSAWTGTQTLNGVTGYVSGPCGQGMHNCPNFGLNNVYVHDFGSILAFTEWNFSPQLPFIDGADKGYADYNAPDWGGTPGGAQVPLLDFFQLNQPRQFAPVPTGQWTYNCFTAWGSCAGTSGPYVPEDPDDY